MIKQELIMVDKKEIKRAEVIQLIKAGKISQIAGATELSLTTRHLRRLQKSYAKHGLQGLVSKHRGKVSNNKTPLSLENQIIEIIQNNYSDFYPTLAQEKLLENHGIKISTETVRKLMIQHGLWEVKSQRKKTEKKVHQMRTRRPSFGELVQIDGSPHAWFEDRAPSCCLIVFIDDATSKLLALHFVENECLQGYFDATRKHIEKHGRPLSYYSDKHAIFKVNAAEAKSGTGETQFGRSCRELGIKIINAPTPQAKGRVERANKTLQNRLTKELRLKNISDIAAANKYLPEFIEQYNNKFGVEPASTVNSHRKNLPTPEQLNLIFSKKSNRVISKSLEVHYANKIYQIQAKTPCYSMRQQKVLVCERNNEVTLIYKNKILDYVVFDKNNKPNESVESKDIDREVDALNNEHDSQDKPWEEDYPAEIAVKAAAKINPKTLNWL